MRIRVDKIDNVYMGNNYQSLFSIVYILIIFVGDRCRNNISELLYNESDYYLGRV